LLLGDYGTLSGRTCFFILVGDYVDRISLRDLREDHREVAAAFLVVREAGLDLHLLRDGGPGSIVQRLGRRGGVGRTGVIERLQDDAAHIKALCHVAVGRRVQSDLGQQREDAAHHKRRHLEFLFFLGLVELHFAEGAQVGRDGQLLAVDAELALGLARVERDAEGVEHHLQVRAHANEERAAHLFEELAHELPGTLPQKAHAEGQVAARHLLLKRKPNFQAVAASTRAWFPLTILRISPDAAGAILEPFLA